MNDILKRIHEINDQALCPTGMEEAVIGVVERCGMEPQILLDRNKCIEILMRGGIAWEEAEDFFESNVIGAWKGDHTPLFATLNKDLA